MNPTAQRYYDEYVASAPVLGSRLIARDFLEWLGGRIDSGPTAGDVMEYLWGYRPMQRLHFQATADQEPPDLAAFLRFLGQKSVDLKGCQEIAADQRTFSRRFQSYMDAPFSLWAEELRLMVTNAGFQSTIPPIEGDEVLADAPLLFRGEPGLHLAGEMFARNQEPPEEALSQLAARAMALKRSAEFAEFVGPGRKLTQKGNLTRADGKILAEAFGEGHLVDQKIGGRVFKTVSSSEIPAVDLTFQWTRAAGFVTIKHGKVHATARGRRIGRDPLDDWVRLFRSFVGKLRWMERTWPADTKPFWAPLVTNFGYSYLGQVAGRGDRGMALMALALPSWQEFSRQYHTEHLTPEQVSMQISMMEILLRMDLFGPLADLGAAEVWMSAVEGAAKMTPLGLWAVRSLCEELFGEQKPAEGARIIMFPVPAPSSNGKAQ
ncbi:MAG: hypothetical protein ACR2FO_00450 [Actinomycetota bacterium]